MLTEAVFERLQSGAVLRTTYTLVRAGTRAVVASVVLGAILAVIAWLFSIN